ncbi:MAG: Aerobic respiration control sensor protein ArcB [Elusimicrobia bacterium ADurb.Bin231]|nr:MAG: Aerobic respiration control sensor protein ArcB [Elusimicrobia bacterium ADurb.Bin231]
MIMVLEKAGKNIPKFYVYLFVGSIVFFILISLWIFKAIDGNMRKEFLEQANSIAQTLDPIRIKTLSGTAADLQNPNYTILKDQFIFIKHTNKKLKFVYLMGLDASNKIFIFVDNEPVLSADYSPPGQLYDEAPESFKKVFNTNRSTVIYPVKDRWGVWISALVPIIDPATGKSIAVVGIDIEARKWKMEFLSTFFVPVGIILFLFSIIFSIILSRRNIEVSPKPVLKRLLLPLGSIFFLFTILFGRVIFLQQKERLDRTGQIVMKDVTSILHIEMASQIKTMSAIIELLMSDAALQKALKEKDRHFILSRYDSVFKKFRNQYLFTHFHFIDNNRYCLARLHRPEIYGDRINRSTVIKAERTGKPVAGIEIATLGALTIRSVHPVYAGNTLIGYLELGKELDDIFAHIHDNLEVEVFITIKKELLRRQDWETEMNRLGKVPDWDRFNDYVMVYSSLKKLPVSACDLMNRVHLLPAGKHAEFRCSGLDWRLKRVPLKDISGTVIGNMLIMRNIVNDKASYRRLMTVSIVVSTVSFAWFFGFLYVILRRVDTGMALQQKNLKESEEQFRTLVSNIPGVTYRCRYDENWTMLYMSSEVHFVTGYNVSDLINNKVCSFADIIYKEDTEKVAEVIKKAIDTGKAWDMEYRIIHKNGGIVWVQEKGRAVYDIGGTVRYLDGVIINITERKLFGLELSAREERIKSLLESMQDLVFVLDDKFIFQSYHQPASDKLFIQSKEFVGKHFNEVGFPEPALSKIKSGLEKTLNSGQVSQIEYWLDMPHGRLWFDMSVSPYRPYSGKILGVTCVVRDITLRRQAEEEMKKAVAIKTDFISMVSHELRTPLAVIKEGINIVADGSCGDINEEQKKYLSTAQRNIQRLGRLVTDVLDIQKMEAGLTEFDIIANDLNRLIREIGEDMTRVASQKGLAIKFNIDDKLPSVKFDMDKINQVLTNLINNAIKFTDAGEINLGTVFEENKFAKVYVSDTGPGIKTEDIPKLFQKFAQIAVSNNRKPGGTGLGLAICKEIIERHNGKIWAESEFGKGTTFYFILPVEEINF